MSDPRVGATADWRRLDMRMLLVHPVRELFKYIPVLLGAVIVGTQSGGPAWSPVAVAVVIVAFALTRWFTTSYRIGADTVQLRRGLLQRRTLTVPRTRIRSVDVHADLMHRLLGLVVLVIGTGQHADREKRFHLDGVDARQVPELRALLLRPAENTQPDTAGAAGAFGGDSGPFGRTAALAGNQGTEPEYLERNAERTTEATRTPRSDATGSRSADATAPPDHSRRTDQVHNGISAGRAALQRALNGGESGALADDAIEIGHWQPRWVRYAPLSLTGLAIVGPVIGLAAKVGVADVLVHSQAVQDLTEHSAVFIALAVTGAVVVLLVIAAIAACIRYLTTYFGLRVLDDGTALHIRGGLFTTRQTTLDLSRLRGATVKEPLLLRLAGGAELEAIMTGTSPRQKLLPQAPRAAVDRTLAQLLTSRSRRETAASEHAAPQQLWDDLATAAAPASVALEQHGPRARRRRYTRAFIPVWILLATFAAIVSAGLHVPPWAWVVPAIVALFAAALAHDRYRGLGHAVIPSDGARPVWLITRRGSLDRDRDCLEAPGVIGWTVRQTFFQRRAGLATVIAASAAGKKKYSIVDLPIERAWALIDQVTPGQLGVRAEHETTPVPTPDSASDDAVAKLRAT
ncbi:PH domain-containing protein [Nocardia elegans]|uniref:PH domain-containing protein n=1 Tax=Nocardia elegans TaxID=300029 RepID=A0ABW6TCP1_9NOCA|nr:PH domain-containing protein [Nocardia elegans]